MLHSVFSKPYFQYLIAIVFGIISGLFFLDQTAYFASVISDLFIRSLKLVSLPIIFLSIVSVASSMQDPKNFKTMFKKVIVYTLFTTMLAAIVSLLVFLCISPVQKASSIGVVANFVPEGTMTSYWTHLFDAIPSNFFMPFSSNNVIQVVVVAFLFSAGCLAIAPEQRKSVHLVFSSIYSIFMKITTWIVKIIPIALWGFIVLFVEEVEKGLQVSTIGYYLICVVSATTIQAVIVLPLFLRYHGVSTKALLRAMAPALSVAFFTKSSTATVPTAVRCAQEDADISSEVANFTFPLCTTINMNGCAAFILTTVLFVSMMNGVTFSIWDMVLWVFISTLAAVGNAGVPMGCYFLSSAFLASMNVPMSIMGVILPFYSFLDAYETSVNVWSDACVAAVVDKQVRSELTPTEN